jgi:hypothetical protein
VPPLEGKSLSVEERLTKLENKLLMVARSTDGNTEVMLGGLQTIDTRLAMLFLILEDVVASLPAHLLMMKVGDRRKIDLDHYEKKALEALAAQDPKPVAKEPASDGEEVAVFFGGKE